MQHSNANEIGRRQFLRRAGVMVASAALVAVAMMAGCSRPDDERKKEIRPGRVPPRPEEKEE